MLTARSDGLISVQETNASKKRERRDYLLGKRLKLPDAEVRDKSSLIAKRILDLEAVRNANNVCVYVAIKNEVKTRKIIDFLIFAKKRVFLPKFDPTVGYVFSEFRGWENLEEGPAHIPQPKGSVYAGRGDIDLAIVPGIAFDRRGVRLGYGKGVYDRLLASSGATRIGLAYDFQIVDELPQEAHDLICDIVVTEERIIATSK